MLNKITTADARKKFSNIINRVAFGDESFVLTRRGEPIAALVSMRELKILQEIEDKIDRAIFKKNNSPRRKRSNPKQVKAKKFSLFAGGQKSSNKEKTKRGGLSCKASFWLMTKIISGGAWQGLLPTGAILFR